MFWASSPSKQQNFTRRLCLRRPDVLRTLRNHLFAALHNSSVTLRRHKAVAASSPSFARALNYEYTDGVDYRGLTALTSLSMAVSE
ncbi:hypothetical protein [Candidatus Reidiella endopervernicosa]|uniref:Uncharacterized protein n=1 Tax=Candidatus Reidiella endopervernicosa TaxID=2738883 RepID=A0A6N0HTA4_9GAMM|nr:hypothetical protein [Candidatus Reidiella endopervernicosa]QKQ25628.1 hypothetical protein HUE57_04445 [Candidatus Reidiella endopervernicosa]